MTDRHEEPSHPPEMCSDELIGLDPEDPEVRAFAEHLNRMRTTHPNYTVEGYLSNVSEFANSANRSNGHRRLMAVLVVGLLLLGVAYAVYGTLSVIFSTLFG